jgi:hypothetical protein
VRQCRGVRGSRGGKGCGSGDGVVAIIFKRDGLDEGMGKEELGG